LTLKLDSLTFLVNGEDIPAFQLAVSHISDVGYCETAIRKRLGLSDITDIQWRALPIYREERLAERDLLALAIDLFFLQGEISARELDRLLNKEDQNIFIQAKVLAIDKKRMARACVSLFPVGKLLVFSDHAWPKLPHPGYINIPHNQVMSLGADSHWLARITVRQPVRAALDLCTGSGIHALLAASHSRQVLAVDINPRAISCTRFNARASGRDNVEGVVGDLFDPVRGKLFDLITANPPFVPSPVNDLGFRDGGRSGEDVQRRIVEGLPHYLALGGIAQIVTELGERDDDPIPDRLRRWLGNAPMDILILRLREHSTTNYAIGHAQGDYDFGVFLDSVHDWANNLKLQKYSRIVSVLISFQWSDQALGPPWVKIVETPPPLGDAGSEIQAMFKAERIARNLVLQGVFGHGRFRRAGQIALLEARMIDSNLRTDVRAQLLGKSLSAFHWLDPITHNYKRLCYSSGWWLGVRKSVSNGITVSLNLDLLQIAPASY